MPSKISASQCFWLFLLIHPLFTYWHFVEKREYCASAWPCSTNHLTVLSYRHFSGPEQSCSRESGLLPPGYFGWCALGGFHRDTVASVGRTIAAHCGAVSADYLVDSCQLYHFYKSVSTRFFEVNNGGRWQVDRLEFLHIWPLVLPWNQIIWPNSDIDILLDNKSGLHDCKTIEREGKRSTYVALTMLPTTGMFHKWKESESGTST
jgi:hypothetical protein